jgi:ATPase subunit of ABC transporter with duplicated ATPase domains
MPVKDRGITSSFQQENFSGKEIAILNGVSKSYGENKILDDISIKVYRGERVALLGRNGCGKTTLLKLITNEEQPDSGTAKLGESIKYALLQQNIAFEKPERSVLDTIRYDLEISDSAARNLLAAYKFRGSDVFKKVEALSGGEKTRLMLCLLMQKDVNMLILDEPTNHLDIASREWIEECVEEFGGTILFVSHDRYFISRFAEKIWELENGRISTFQGTYEEYKQSRAKLPEAKEKEKAKELKQKLQTRQRKSDEATKEKSKDALEQQIAQLEDRIKELDAEMEQTGSDYQRLELLMKEKQELSEVLDGLYEEWMG